jgi:tRNA-dihydrouridine synthase B
VVGQIAAGLSGGAPLPTPAGVELAAVVVEHYEGVLSEYGVHVGVRAARKHLDWYLKAADMPVAASVRRRMIESNSPREVIGMIDSLFAQKQQEAA